MDQPVARPVISCRRPAVLLIALLLLLGGCSLPLPFLYRQLDWIIPWQVRNYVSLNAEQHSMLARRLEGLLDWHCSTQLPQYALWLRRLADDRRWFERARLEQHAMRLTGYWDSISRRAASDVAELLLTAGPEQVSELLEAMEADNREQGQEHRARVEQGTAAVVEHRASQMRDRLERWFGGLNDEQRVMVRRWSERVGVEERWLEGRRQWQTRLGEILRSDSASAPRRVMLERLFAEPDHIRSTDYRAWMERRRAATLDLLARVGESLSTEQQLHLKQELVSLAEDLSGLVCRPGEENAAT